MNLDAGRVSSIVGAYLVAREPKFRSKITSFGKCIRFVRFGDEVARSELRSVENKLCDSYSLADQFIEVTPQISKK